MKVLKLSPMDRESMPVSSETTSDAEKQSVAEKIKFSCDLCGAPFYHKFGLLTHKRRLHGDEKPTTQTFVVLRKPEKNCIRKRNNKIKINDKKTLKPNYNNVRKNAKVEPEIREIKENKDYIVSLEICDEDKPEEENVILEICDVDEKPDIEKRTEKGESLSTSPDPLSETSDNNIENNVTTVVLSDDSFESNDNKQNCHSINRNAPVEFVDTNIETHNVIPSTFCETDLQDNMLKCVSETQDDISSEMQEANSSTLDYYIIEESGGKFYDCSKCTRRYKHKRSLFRHIQEVHFPTKIKGDEQYICTTCNLAYKIRKSASAHLIRKHTANKIVCLLCQKSFRRPSILSKHMIKNHCTVKNFKGHSSPSVSPAVHPYTEQDKATPPEQYHQPEEVSQEEYKPTVFLPIECDILPVEFEVTKVKEEMMEIEIEGIA